MARNKDGKGISLAKGPVALIGLALLVFGVLAFILGGHSFAARPLSGTVEGRTWLGVETNAWSSLLFIGAGLLLVFGAPAHWAAKSMSLIVGLVLGAASVIALYDRQDVFGIFAANGLTKLIWGVAATLLILLSLLPRVGGGRKRAAGPGPRRAPAPAEPAPASSGRFRRDDDRVAEDRTGDEGHTVAPAAGTTPESRETTRRQREHGEF